jgi:tRNA-specific 2-thiouridylase
MAEEYGLHRVALKPDSYEICFVPDNDYRRFLTDRVAGLQESVEGGDFVLEDGTVVGKHRGYPFYTIGQRRGLGVSFPDPMYVVHIDPDTNRVTLGPRDSLLEQRLVAGKLNFVKVPDLREERPVTAAIRYNDDGAPALAWQTGNDELEVAFRTPRRAITPGQSVVVYEEEDLLAGGWIQKVVNEE